MNGPMNGPMSGPMSGKVYLLGAGPGAIDYLTVAGARLLAIRRQLL